MNLRLKHHSIIKHKNIVFTTINNINSVGYKINKYVLNFIRLHGLTYVILHDSYHTLNEKINRGEKLLKWEKR